MSLQLLCARACRFGVLHHSKQVHRKEPGAEDLDAFAVGLRLASGALDDLGSGRGAAG